MSWEQGGGFCPTQDRIGAPMCLGFKAKSFQCFEAVGPAQHSCGVSGELSCPGWKTERFESYSSLLMAGTEMPALPPASCPRSWRQRRAAGSPQTAVPTLNNSPQTPLPLLWGQSAKIGDSKDTKGLMSPPKSCLPQAVLWAAGKVSVRAPECQHCPASWSAEKNQIPSQRHILQDGTSQRNKFW